MNFKLKSYESLKIGLLLVAFGLFVSSCDDEVHTPILTLDGGGAVVTSVMVDNAIEKMNLDLKRTSTFHAVIKNATSIGDEAFKGCTKLQSVVFPVGLQTIGEQAFYECKALQSLPFPNGLKTIEYRAFYNSENLESVVFPDGLQTIGDQAFYNCQALQSIEFPDGLQSIGLGAFYWGSKLKSLVFPATLQSIGPGAFLMANIISSMTFYCIEPPSFVAHATISFSMDASGATITIPKGADKQKWYNTLRNSAGLTGLSLDNIVFAE